MPTLVGVAVATSTTPLTRMGPWAIGALPRLSCILREYVLPARHISFDKRKIGCRVPAVWDGSKKGAKAAIRWAGDELAKALPYLRGASRELTRRVEACFRRFNDVMERVSRDYLPDEFALLSFGVASGACVYGFARGG